MQSMKLGQSELVSQASEHCLAPSGVPTQTCSQSLAVTQVFPMSTMSSPVSLPHAEASATAITQINLNGAVFTARNYLDRLWTP